MSNTYFDPRDLANFAKITENQPEMGKKFFDWYGEATSGDSALTQREKALIGLAIAHTVQCPYCVDAYTTSCLESGADDEQMMEAVHVAAAVKAGSSLVYATQMRRHLQKISM